MENTNPNDIIAYILLGTAIMLFLALTIILFVVIAKRNSDRDKIEKQKLKIQHQKDMFKSIISTQEKERKRIAKNLHDDIGTSLSAVGLMVSHLKSTTQGKNKEIATTTKKEISKIVVEVSNVLNDLSPSALITFGLFVGIDELANTIERSSNIKVEFSSNIENGRLSEEMELTLYRIIKEFCNNSIKYAKASKISIRIDMLEHDILEMAIKDDGDGFDVSEKEGKGHGLNNMQSRAYLLGGLADFSSAPGKGTHLNIKFPLTQEDFDELNTES